MFVVPSGRETPREASAYGPLTPSNRTFPNASFEDRGAYLALIANFYFRAGGDPCGWAHESDPFAGASLVQQKDFDLCAG